MRLSGWRRAGGAVERKRIRWSCVLRERGVPGDLLRSGEQVEGRCRQRGHVQRLANVASGVLPVRAARVVVERRAGDEIQQRQATQYGQRAALALVPENGPQQVHTPIVSVYSLDGRKTRLVAQDGVLNVNHPIEMFGGCPLIRRANERAILDKREPHPSIPPRHPLEENPSSDSGRGRGTGDAPR
jgi:hypothetical protein